MSELAAWRDFYATIATAAGVLVGATFVVATLSAGLGERAKIGMHGFITPIAVHLGSVLVIAAILTAPVLTPMGLALFLCSAALAGGTYGLAVAARIWSMKLDIYDRVFYIVLPLLADGAMLAAGIRFFTASAFTLLAGSLVLLLIVGMRNAWDMASFMITRGPTDGA